MFECQVVFLSVGMEFSKCVMSIVGVPDKLFAEQPTTNGKAAPCCTGSGIYKELTLHEQHGRTSNYWHLKFPQDSIHDNFPSMSNRTVNREANLENV